MADTSRTIPEDTEKSLFLLLFISSFSDSDLFLGPDMGIPSLFNQPLTLDNDC